MTTTIKCNKDFTLNERNSVDISSESKLKENDNLVVVDNNGNVVFDVTIKNMKESNQQVRQRSIFEDCYPTTLFVGEPVLDLMIDTTTNTAEYVPGGQALSQAVAFKNANPDKKSSIYW